jgi:3-phenylpropionate/trans-cinnamate dioxygenase ferredoxin subunit
VVAADAKTKRRLAFPKSDLPPGARKVVTSGRREIAVLNVDGRLHAVFNRCPHHQAPLHRGTIGGATIAVPGAPVGTFEFGLEGRVLRCPWHHYEFDLENGRCLAEPDRLRIACYEVRQEGEEIAVYV